MWIYIFKIKDDNPFNDYHKIGISGDVRTRLSYIKRSLKEAGLRDDIQVRFKAWIIGAYFVEQFLHRVYKRKRKRMPEKVAGYTEFFDLNFINVLPIILFLSLLEFSQVIIMITIFYQIVK